ncbi:MAG: STAS domain-containing protein [Bacteroidales bacterium]|jgi:anti-sigma B factor antagonist|nr:STAS domain-containing protein [Bacteroidales bacterium]
MEVKITEKDNVMTAQLIGRLDTAVSQEVATTLQPVIEQANKTIVLDCKELSYISSSGLRIFLTIRKAAAGKGGKVIVRDINNEIRQVFMMTGFLNLFEIQES